MKPLTKILYVSLVDRDNYDAISRAATLAEHSQATLTVVSVVTPPRGYRFLHGKSVFKGLLDSEILHNRQYLDDLCEELESDTTSLDISIDVLVGKFETEVIKEVLRGEYDLVIKPGEEIDVISSVIFGSADINLMRKCPCPVLIVKPDASEKFKVIVAAVDRDEEAPENHLLNLEILKFATWLALVESSELHVVHTWGCPSSRFYCRAAAPSQGRK